jgi:hypothetical protein
MKLSWLYVCKLLVAKQLALICPILTPSRYYDNVNNGISFCVVIIITIMVE